MNTHIIYIPGLGDRYDRFRRFALRGWRFLGVSTELVSITWYDGGDFNQKYGLVSSAIQRASSAGKRVVIVGESAGATLALHAGKNEPDVSRVITLCGVATSNTPVSTYLRRRAPALDRAVDTIETSAHPDIHSIRAAVDNVVNKSYSIADGATEHVVWTIGHFTTIALCLTVLSPLVVHIAKSTEK